MPRRQDAVWKFLDHVRKDGNCGPWGLGSVHKMPSRNAGHCRKTPQTLCQMLGW